MTPDSVASPAGIYQRAMRQIAEEHETVMADITRAANSLTEAVERAEARRDAQRQQAWDAYQLALKAGH